MSERDKKLLVYLGAMIILAIPYFFVVRPFLDKMDALDAQKIQLTSTLTEKKNAYAKQQEYIDEIDRMDQEIEKILAKFPEDNADEKSIMFAYNAENDVPMNFSQLTFAEDTEMLIEESEQANEDTSEEDIDSIANPEKSEPNVIMPDGIPSLALDQMAGRRTDLGMTFSTSYQGFKDYIAYIRDYKDRLVITSIDTTYDGVTGLVSGNMILSQYALLGPDRELPATETGVEDKLGTENIFRRDGSSGTILDLIDMLENLMGDSEQSEQEQEITADYTIMVDASTENTNAITIGRTENDVDGESYLTSNENEKVDVYFSMYGENGNYYARYNVGGKEYEDTPFERTSNDKLCLKIQSTYRINDRDNVSANIHVKNDTDLELVVMTVGDDPSQPRIEIVEKNGNIVVK